MNKISRKSPIRIVIGSTLGLLLALCFTTAGPFLSVTGQGVTAAEANKKLWACHVPQDATDVWYESSYRTTWVECNMNKPSFLKWCRERQWEPHSDSEQIVRSLREGQFLSIRGLYFNVMNGDFGERGVFDEENRRCYVVRSGG